MVGTLANARFAHPTNASLRREQLLAFRPVERLVERAPQLVEQLVDLGRLDDHRRTDRDNVAADDTHDQAFGLRLRDDLRADALLGIERLLLALHGGELERADQAHAARFPD